MSYKNLVAPIILIVVSIAALVFSLIALPLFMSWVAIFCVIGSILVIVGCIFWILKVTLGSKFKVGNGLKNFFLWSGITCFVLPVIIVGCILLANSFVPPSDTTNSTTTAATTEGTTAATTEGTTAATTAATTGPDYEGIDLPMEGWTFVPAGSIISGDIALYDGDNNNRKSPFYDSSSATADFVYIAEDCNIWTEWGGFLWTPEKVNANEITGKINKKLGEFPKVRLFAYDGTSLNPAKNCVIYTSDVNVDEITSKLNEFATK